MCTCCVCVTYREKSRSQERLFGECGEQVTLGLVTITAGMPAVDGVVDVKEQTGCGVSQ